MSSASAQSHFKIFKEHKSMQAFGETFIEGLPKHLENLKIPGRVISDTTRGAPLHTQIEQTTEIQNAMHEVLFHKVTQEAQAYAENTFNALIKKNKADTGVLKFFNGWNETHKTTSLVSAKIIMRLSADAVSIPIENRTIYNICMAHMHEVAKDDFGLGHKGHDGMYLYMTAAFGASGWVENQYKVNTCDEFAAFLYKTGVSEHKSPMDSAEHKKSIMNAMMVSIASELWNGREYNFLAQYIEKKLLSLNPSLRNNIQNLQNAKSYVLSHSGEIENKHGLHALAAAQTYARIAGLKFETSHLKKTMLDYNKRIGNAFSSLHAALTSSN